MDGGAGRVIKFARVAWELLGQQAEEACRVDNVDRRVPLAAGRGVEGLDGGDLEHGVDDCLGCRELADHILQGVRRRA